MQAHFIRDALDLLGKGKSKEAHHLLMETVSQMPDGWKATDRREDREVVHCWSLEEFAAYSDFRAKSASRPHVPVVWMSGSYAHAYYLLALLAREKQELEAALSFVEQALRLEGDHPEVLCLRGFLLRQSHRLEEAVATYRQALTMRPWATKAQQARAWRGLGGCLLDLEKVDEAEMALQHSLVLEPGNRMAQSEIDCIRAILAGREVLGEQQERKAATELAKGSNERGK